jgi:high-affinity K+ transport system ATPase subunit B
VIVNKLSSADGDVVPCDCLLLRGSAVVNEATLTGQHPLCCVVRFCVCASGCV